MKTIGMTAALAFAAASNNVYAETLPTTQPSLEEMWEIIQKQNAQIEQLNEQLDVANEEIKETKVIVNSTADVVEEQQSNGGGVASSWTEKWNAAV